MSTHAAIDYSKAVELLKEHMDAEGYLTEHDEKAQTFKLLGQTYDTKGKIIAKTSEMIRRTQDVNMHYQSQIDLQKQILEGK